MTIRPARFSDECDAVRALFREYAAEIAINLCFQGFQHELDTLPGAYAPPGGEVLLAEIDRSIVGCVAVRPLKPPASGCRPKSSSSSVMPVYCEMKRLYVRPAARGLDCGRRLTAAILETSRAMGYSHMRLDTLATMAAARSLYRSLGFVEIDAYYDNPLGNVIYMELALHEHGGSHR